MKTKKEADDHRLFSLNQSQANLCPFHGSPCQSQSTDYKSHSLLHSDQAAKVPSIPSFSPRERDNSPRLLQSLVPVSLLIGAAAHSHCCFFRCPVKNCFTLVSAFPKPHKNTDCPCVDNHRPNLHILLGSTV